MPNDYLALRTVIESIDKIALYSHSNQNADETWDIINNHLPKLRNDIQTIIENNDF